MTEAEAAWERAGIPLRLKGCRLATSPQAALYPDLVHRLIAPWDPSREATEQELADWDGFWGQSWMLFGLVGRGKSGLAAGYAHQWVDPRFGEPPSNILWCNVPDLLLRLRETYNYRTYGRPFGRETEFSIIKACREADLLILDDLGAEHINGSGWVQEKLYQIISRRHEDMRPTFFTSNLTLGELNDQIGERIAWRIAEMCGEENVVLLDGPNLRGGSEA